MQHVTYVRKDAKRSARPPAQNHHYGSHVHTYRKRRRETASEDMA